MPRSGTKLLRSLLNGHSRVGIPEAETEFLPQWERDWESFGDLTDRAQFRDFAARVQGSAYFTYLREEQGRERSWEDWHHGCRDGSLPAVFEALIRLDAEVPVDGVWGDKSPGYIAHLDLIERHFPGARVVHIVRDVRDYCLSIHKAWGKDMLRAAQRWVDCIDAIAQRELLLVRYEDLLEAPEAELSRICSWLGLDFEPAMTELDHSVENLGDTRGQVGIQRENRAKYLSSMEPKMRARIEALAGPTLQRLGYSVDGVERATRLSPGRMAMGQVHDGIQLVRSDVALRGWAGALRFRWRLFRETGRREKLRSGGSD
jgi:hypothetical protein